MSKNELYYEEFYEEGWCDDFILNLYNFMSRNDDDRKKVYIKADRDRWRDETSSFDKFFEFAGGYLTIGILINHKNDVNKSFVVEFKFKGHIKDKKLNFSELKMKITLDPDNSNDIVYMNLDSDTHITELYQILCKIYDNKMTDESYKVLAKLRIVTDELELKSPKPEPKLSFWQKLYK